MEKVEKHKYSIEEIAYFYVDFAYTIGEQIDINKLNLLCYYAYAWYIVLNNENDENIVNFLSKTDYYVGNFVPINHEFNDLFGECDNDYFNTNECIIDINHSAFKGIKKIDMQDDINILMMVWNTYERQNMLDLRILLNREDPWVVAKFIEKYYVKSNCLIDSKVIYNYYSNIYNNK